MPVERSTTESGKKVRQSLLTVLQKFNIKPAFLTKLKQVGCVISFNGVNYRTLESIYLHVITDDHPQILVLLISLLIEQNTIPFLPFCCL